VIAAEIADNPDVESRTVSPVIRDVFRRVFLTRRRDIADQIEDWLEQWRD
jgi:hypothetical protein